MKTVSKTKKNTLQKDAEFSPNDALYYLRILHRVWMRPLSAAEFKIVAFVFDRTIGWRKRRERITLRQLSNGVPSGDGSLYSGGTGLSRRTIIDALSRLTGEACRDEKGLTPLVKEVDSPHWIWYSLNFDWKPTGSHCKGVDSANIAPKECGDCTVNGAANAPLRVQKLPPKIIELREKKKDNKTEVGNRSSEPVSSTSTNSFQRHQTESASKKRTSVSALNVLWNTAMAKEFPEAAVWDWTSKERGMVVNLRKKWEDSGNGRGEFGDFLQWCVNNWGPMMLSLYPSKRYRYWRGPPLPSLSYLSATVRTFFDLYQSADIAAMRKENSASKIAQNEKHIATLKDKKKQLGAELKKHRDQLDAIKLHVNLARHGLRPQPLLSPEELGFEVKVADCRELLDRYNRG